LYSDEGDDGVDNDAIDDDSDDDDEDDVDKSAKVMLLIFDAKLLAVQGHDRFSDPC
jgi:hypothetical protein